MDQVARVVLALEAPEVAEEVMHFLDRSGRARVVATAADDRQLAEAVRQLEPDAVVAEPGMLSGATASGVVLALDVRESVSSLRTAIRAGAAGYFLWPKERDELLGAAAVSVRRAQRSARRGTVLAVHGGRGGSGVTFVATHLAAAFARRSSAVLIDADPVFGDVAQALDAPAGDDVEPTHTFADAASLGEDLGPEQLKNALWHHESGIDVLLPPPPEVAARLGPADLRLVTDAAAGVADVVILHLPRALGPVSLAAAETAERLLEVVTLDVLSFRATSRSLEACGSLHLEGRVGFVVNKAARSEITPGDVQRVFGEPALAVLPHDRAVRSAQDRNRLLPGRGRMARRFDRLADALSTPIVNEMAS
jgi:Flp pilus assembly CpaE family ATPase